MSKRRQNTNWTEVRQRIERSRRALEATEGVATERLRVIYRRRAVRLATRQRRAESMQQFALLVFLLGTERYGLALPSVVQVFSKLPCTPIPGSPSPLLGVSNFHGEIRSVIDLRRLLKLPDNESPAADLGHRSDSAPGYLLLLRSAAGEFALRVDQVEAIQHLDQSQWNAAVASRGQVAAEYATGVTADNIIVLDADSLARWTDESSVPATHARSRIS